MTLSPSSSTNFSRTRPLTCRRQRLWKLQPRTVRTSRFWEAGRVHPCSGRPRRPPPGGPSRPVLPEGLSQLPQRHWSRPQGSLWDSPNSGTPVGRLTPAFPNALGIRSQGTLSAAIHLNGPGPCGRVCLCSLPRQGNGNSGVPPARPPPQWPRGSPPAAGPASGRQGAAGGPGAGRRAPSGGWRRLPGLKAGLGQ